jgi:F-type H+-transporting ATPase subunit alpha
MKAWEAAFLRFMETSYPEIGKDIAEKKIIAEDNEARLKDAIKAFGAGWQG